MIQRTKFSFPKSGDVVRDLEGRRYRLVEQINQGKQGAVFSTEDADILIKVCVPPHSRNSQDLRHHLRLLTRRNIETDSLVLPRAVLDEPHLGYIMERVKDAIPLSYLVYYPNNHDPNWYFSTGGLRRRLRIAAELARTFQQVHRNGLCYVDLSWQNVLVPSDPIQTSIKLIDPDNLITPGTSLAQVIGTEEFIAPELLKETRFPNHASDRWSLAVTIFYLLVLNHPFRGDKVQEGEPELEEKALRGEFPFIDSKNNNENHSSWGLPRGKVLTRRLKELSMQAFEIGLVDPWARPSPEEWLKALEQAADETALCASCNTTSYLPDIRGSALLCDWCGKTSNRPIELAFFYPEPSIDDLDNNEIKELRRSRKPDSRFILDKEQRMVPKRLMSDDPEDTGYIAQFGFQRNQSGDKIYGLRNLSKDTWATKDITGRKANYPPAQTVLLFDETVIFLNSRVRVKVRNP